MDRLRDIPFVGVLAIINRQKENFQVVQTQVKQEFFQVHAMLLVVIGQFHLIATVHNEVHLQLYLRESAQLIEVAKINSKLENIFVVNRDIRMNIFLITV